MYHMSFRLLSRIIIFNLGICWPTPALEWRPEGLRVDCHATRHALQPAWRDKRQRPAPERPPTESHFPVTVPVHARKPELPTRPHHVPIAKWAANGQHNADAQSADEPATGTNGRHAEPEHAGRREHARWHGRGSGHAASRVHVWEYGRTDVRILLHVAEPDHQFYAADVAESQWTRR